MYRQQNLKRRYGISLDDYEAMLSAQNGVCAICHEPPEEDKFLSVDHWHIENVVRGLLCHRCNTGLGLFQEDINRLASAIQYLMSYPSGGYI